MIRRSRIFQRSGKQSTGRKTYGIGVPWQIAEAIPTGTEFRVVLTEEGILFQPVIDVPAVVSPTWIKRVEQVA